MKIVIAGLLSTIQDRGRYGYLKSGIGTNGVMDTQAYDTANALVGNENGEAVIETTFMGPAIEFDEECICAITGADMEPKLDDEPVEMYQPFKILPGQTLSMGMAVNGFRGYIAFAGGIDVPVVMNSRSTNLKCKIGGYEGRALAKDDILAIGESSIDESSILSKSASKPFYENTITARVIEGPQADYFTEEGKQTFYSNEYEVMLESDRMGFRLEGPEIENIDGVDIVSDGIAFGAIQVPPSGKPIILLADRQTTGGYAKIATVISDDIPKLVQLPLGGKVRFAPVEIEEPLDKPVSIRQTADDVSGWRKLWITAKKALKK